MREEGIGGFLRNIYAYATSVALQTYDALVLTVATPQVIASFKTQSERVRGLKGLVEFSYRFSFLGFSFKPVQLRSEITELLNILQKRNIHAMLEIGTDSGGTLFLFSHVSAPDAKIISINLPWSTLNEYCMRYRNILYKNFATQRQQMNLLTENSHEQATLTKTHKLLKGNKLDFLFIDGDHSYDGVKQDFEMYAPLVRKGGVVAFHDIAMAPESKSNPVYKYWMELRAKHGNRSSEIVHSDRYGIGVIYL